MSTLLMTIVLLGIGTIAYFRRTVNGNITGQSGNLVLIVNEVDAVANENFSITLERSETENFILPDDSGSFDLNIDATGSTDNVGVNISISRTNLPDNLNFYLDSDHTHPLGTYGIVIPKSNDMTKTITIYWFWDGSKDDENDSLFIDKTISANVSVNASIAKSLYETLRNSSPIVDTDVDFGSHVSIASGGTEGYDNGLIMRDGTQADEYPIIYYRGEVSNNNVIFANYCWLIVRTTETGGIKLFYNGEVNEHGGCYNYSGVNGGEYSQSDYDNYLAGVINSSGITFNNDVDISSGENGDSPVYAGYMYNDDNKFYDYSTGVLDASGYIGHLANNSIDSETGRHVQNLKDSRAKKIIDEWYEANILGKPEENLLEDTVWCNDRSVIDETYSIENFTTNNLFYFAAQTRRNGVIDQNTGRPMPNTVKPSLICNRNIDKFTVESSNGNGDLAYPIGMLTADEVVFAGLDEAHGWWGKTTTYLSVFLGNESYWTMSPSYFYEYGVGMFEVNDSEFLHGYIYSSNIRPAISLANRASIISGNGSFESPYRVG